ncbi:MAG: hypothetical protein ACK5MG_10360 [Bacteroidales bacterium]
MKTFITKYLLGFALCCLILATVFRHFLSYGIENESLNIIVSATVLYTIAMFVNGWNFGRKDRMHLPIYDVGFRFHFTTYVVHNVVSELWFALGLNSHYENIWQVHYVVIGWGLFVLIHFFFYISAKQKSVDGLDKDDLFE